MVVDNTIADTQYAGSVEAVEQELAEARDALDTLCAIPHRVATSLGERTAAEWLCHRFLEMGLSCSLESFRFYARLFDSRLLYSLCGLLALVLLWLLPPLGPLLSLALGLVLCLSLFLEATGSRLLLSRLLGGRPSQNVVAILPSSRSPRRRVIFCANHDAPCLSSPWFFRLLRWLYKPLPLRPGWRHLLSANTLSLALLLCLSATAFLALFGLARWLVFLGCGLCLPPLLLTALFSLGAAFRSKASTGACNNASGVSLLLLLAARLLEKRPPDVEYRFVSHGAKEPGMGGSQAYLLAHQREMQVLPTLVINLASLGRGTHAYTVQEGDLLPLSSGPSLISAARLLAQQQDSPKLLPLALPYRLTDAYSYLRQGFDAISLCALDPPNQLPIPLLLHEDPPEQIDTLALTDFVDLALDLARYAARAEGLDSDG